MATSFTLFPKLSRDLRSVVLSHLSPVENARISRVSKEFNTDGKIAAKWKKLLKEEYQDTDDPKNTVATQLEAIKESSLLLHPLGSYCKELQELVDVAGTDDEKFKILEQKARSHFLYAETILLYQPFHTLFAHNSKGPDVLIEISMACKEVALLMVQSKELQTYFFEDIRRLAALGVAHEKVTLFILQDKVFKTFFSENKLALSYLKKMIRAHDLSEDASNTTAIPLRSNN